MSARTAHCPSDRLNILLSLAVPGVILAGLAAASRVPLPGVLAIGVCLSFVMLTNYALIHEAAHRYLHSDRTVNDALGTFTGWHFPLSARFLTLTHQVHHRCNRTDHEMFDCYYPGDNRFVKFCQWYGILIGIHYALVPIGSLIVAVLPKFVIVGIAKRFRSSGVLFDDFDAGDIRRVRLEVAGCLLWWTAMWSLLGLEGSAVAIVAAIAGFHWSTRQYLTHAFTERSVRDGAIVLKAGRLMRCLLLNGNYDLVHHQRPWLPWTHLPAHAPVDVEPIGFWEQYLAMWKGPRPCTGPGPSPERIQAPLRSAGR